MKHFRCISIDRWEFCLDIAYDKIRKNLTIAFIFYRWGLIWDFDYDTKTNLPLE